jgi:hypothetical protein
MFVPTDPTRERERTCFFSIAEDRSGRQICRRRNAGQRRRLIAEREAPERDRDYRRVSEREREREREGGGGFDGGGELR